MILVIRVFLGKAEENFTMLCYQWSNAILIEKHFYSCMHVRIYTLNMHPKSSSGTFTVFKNMGVLAPQSLFIFLGQIIKLLFS